MKSSNTAYTPEGLIELAGNCRNSETFLLACRIVSISKIPSGSRETVRHAYEVRGKEILAETQKKVSKSLNILAESCGMSE